MKKLTLICLVLSLSAVAQNQYFVSTTGSDSNNGTSSGTPWRHISKAIASFSLNPSTGAQINVHAGTYSDENISCGGTNVAVCVNRGGSSTTIRVKLVCDTQWTVPSSAGCLIRDASGGGVLAVTANNVDIGAGNQFGFDMSNPQLAYGITIPCNIQGTGNCSTGNSVHLLGNYLHDLSSAITQCEVNPNGHPAISFNNHHGPYMTDAQMIGNRLTDIGPQNLSSLNGGPGCFNYYGVYFETAQGLIYNNIFENIAGYGIHYYSSPCQGNISNNTVLRTEFPNIIVGGGDCGNGVAQGNVTVANNILGQTGPGWQNIIIGVPGGSGVGSTAHPILITNNLFNGGSAGQFQCVAPCFSTNVNVKTESPPTTTFASYTGSNNDDLHIKAGSIAFSGGAVNGATGGITPATPSTDFNLKTRNATTPTIGAYEFGGGTATPPSAPTSLGVVVQ